MKTHSMLSRTFFAQTFLCAAVLFIGWNVQSVYAISAPTGQSAVCGYGGTSVNVYWTPASGSATQAIRVDGAYDSWSGVCTSMNAGDLCTDNLSPSLNTMYLTISPGVAYKWWIHGVDSAGVWSGAATSYFNCPAAYTLTVNKTANTGSVTSDNAISCPTANTTCTKSSTSNGNVKLTPTAASGYVFSSWTGCDSVQAGTNICTVMMSGAKTVTANFVASAASYTLGIGKNGSGSVTSNPAGISCTGTDWSSTNPTACSKSYTAGTVVTLTATPNSGDTFTGWTGPCSGTGTCSVTMDAAKSPTANFSNVLPAPSNLGPSCAADATTVTYSWTGVSGASYYSVRMDVNPDSFDTAPCALASGGYGASGDYCKDNIGNVTSITLNTGPNVLHNFWVHSRGPANEWGASAARTNISCTTASAPIPPTNLTASCAAGGTSVTLSWSPSTGATSYDLRADKNPLSWSDIWWASNCSTADRYTTAGDTGYSGGVGDYCRNGLTTTSKTLNITPGVDYLWWVHAVNAIGGSPASQSVNINCSAAVPAVPTGITTGAGCVGANSKIDLSWTTSANATSYDVQWCAGASCTPNTLVSGITGTSYTHSSLSAGTIYRYNVRAKNANGSSAYSSINENTAQSCVASPRLIICPAVAPSIAVGNTTALSARYWASLASVPDCTTALYANVTNSAVWSSSNAGMATVALGTVTGVSAGSPTITASYNLLNAPKSVTVTASASCPAGTAKTWTVGGNTCSATTPVANSGTNGSLTDSTTPTTGTAAYLCTNGVWAATPIAGATCSVSSGTDGLCGSANGGTFSSQPVATACAVGAQSWMDATASDGTYDWACLGSGGGNTVSCSANKTAAALPDLAAVNVNPTANSMYNNNAVGTSITFEGRAINSGTVAIAEAGWADVVIDWNGNGVTDSGENYNAFNGVKLGALAPGDSRNLSYTHTFTPADNGTYQYSFSVDTDNSGVATESSDTNNITPWRTFSVIDGSIQASPTSVTLGGTTTLDWNTDGTTGLSCTVTGTGANFSGVSGNEDTGPIFTSGTHTYILACSNGVTSIPVDSVSINVSAGAVDVSANPRTVNPGGQTTINWNLGGQSNCSLTGGGLNLAGLNINGSSAPQTINGRTTYTLSCPSGTDTVIVEMVSRGFET